MTTPEIESILRRAPHPKAPASLKDRLEADALAHEIQSKKNAPLSSRDFRSWLTRWWPALAPAAVSLACAAVFSVQQSEIRGLKQTIQSSAGIAAGTEAVPAIAGERAEVDASVAATVENEKAEIARLKALVVRLSPEVKELEQMRAEDDRLRQQIRAAHEAVLTPDETKALENARDRAFSIQCVNNLKQIGLAVRVWANDHGEMTPPQIQAMSNEVSTPKILVCPADNGRQVAVDWASFTSANTSYEYLAPSVPGEKEPNRVLFRCALHGNICLGDGSVQMGAAKRNPEWLITPNGQLYFEAPNTIESQTSHPPARPASGENPAR